jgi:hypothetical protein
MMALVAPASASALELSTDPELFPDFDPAVSDYVVRCGADEQVRVSAAAPTGTSVSIDGANPRTGAVARTLTVSEGEGFQVSSTTGGATSRYFIRCLPTDFPQFEVTRPGVPQAGWYAVTPVLQPPPGVTRHWAALFDSNGVPVWWMPSPDGTVPMDMKLLPNGNLAWMAFSLADAGFEFELDGSLVRRFDTAGGPIDFHDIQLLPDGNYVLGRYVNTPNHDMTTCGGTNPDLLVDFELQVVTPEGAVVWDWLASEHIALDEVTAAWDDACTGNGDIFHWNSTEVDGDGFVLSFRHLDAIYRIDGDTGEIDWKVGGEPRPESLTVVDDDDFLPGTFSGPHDARILPDGSLTVHDNGSGRATAPRAVRFELDETAGTATRVEEVTDPDAPSSFCCGSTRRLPDGNWVSSWGSRPYFTEQTATGERVLKVSFSLNSTPLFSYRADPIMPGDLTSASLRAGMDAQYPRAPSGEPPSGGGGGEPPAEEPPPEDPGEAAPKDALIRVDKEQRLGRRVHVRVLCEESCEATAKGKVMVDLRSSERARPKRLPLRIRFEPVTSRLEAGDEGRLTLRLSKGELRRVRRARGTPGTRATAELRIAAIHDDRTATRAERTVKLKPKG